MNSKSLPEKNEIDELFLQIRTAHRLLAAYYQRLLPTIEKLATEFDADYWQWQPCRFSKTAKNPFASWKWDMLPASMPRYEFKNIRSSDAVNKGDFVLEFIVINDTGVRDENRKIEPDALGLKVDVSTAQSILKLGVYRAYNNQNGAFETLWNKVDYPTASTDFACMLDNEFITTAFEVPLGDLVTETGILNIKNKIADSLQATLDFKPK